ncbi:MAG: response regulator, partial [Cyanobacteriota bacterium]
IVALNIQRRLEGIGYSIVASVSSGEEAIAAAGEMNPDLVLMDIKLEGSVDGIEAAAQIRWRFQIPIVYLTAYTNEETLNRAKLTEPYGYILKPFEARDLATTIEVALYKHQMEQELREREQWLATTLKSIGDAVITTDAQGLVTFMNPVAEALTRWSLNEVIGNDLNHVFRTINEKTRAVVKNPVRIALQEGTIVGLENHTLLITKDGTEIPINDSAAPIKNERGKILGAVLVFHDNIEQQQSEALLQQENERLKLEVAKLTDQLRQTKEQLKQTKVQLQAEITQRQRLEGERELTLEEE